MSDQVTPDVARVVHRTITTRDLAFVTNSWLKSNRKRGFKYIEPQVYFHWHHKLLEALIPTSNVIVACDIDNPDKIYGYGVARYDGPNLFVHYVYVREGWRGLGIGGSIFRAWMERFAPGAVVWTHTSDGWEDFVKHLRKTGALGVAGIFNPYFGYRLWAAAELAREQR